MFTAQNKVRMHDTDMAGVLYFARQFRFAHDALEDFVASEGLSFEHVFHSDEFVFVIVHAEADYLAALRVGDLLEVQLTVMRVGTTSFEMDYQIYRTKPQRQLVGTAKTVHVTLDTKSRKKIPIPSQLRQKLEKHLTADPKK